jgi:SAM-dependent methyltransferase
LQRLTAFGSADTRSNDIDGHHDIMEDEFDISFGSWQEWREWHQSHPSVFDRRSYDGIARSILEAGFIEPLTQLRVAPRDLTGRDSNWREGLIYDGINSRMRAVMRLIETTFDRSAAVNLRIYAPEALTAFALRLRGIFPRFLGSEFTDDPGLRERLYPVPFENLMALSLPTDTFDLVTSNEVLEHVPNLDKALSEVCRVLKPGGRHIGTCPFRFMDQTSQRRAQMQNGKVVHLMEPEYHGNPMSPLGSLVFETPGWDILQRCRQAGFTAAAMRFVMSKTYGYVSNSVTGIFVLMCCK